MSNLAKNTAIYTIGRIIPQLASFILLPLYSKYISPAEYGIVQSMQVLSTVLAVFFSLATERSIFRLIYEYDSPTLKKQFIGNASILILLVSSLTIILIFAFRSYFNLIFSSIPFNPYFIYTVVNTFFLAFFYVPNNLFQVEGSAMKFVGLSLACFFCNAAFVIYYVIFLKEGASGMLKGQMIGSGVMFLIYIPIIIRQSIFKINLVMVKNIFRFSLPMIPSLIASWVIAMSNRIFLETYSTLHDVGIYSTAFKIASISTVFMSAIYTAYTPVFYKYANHTDQKLALKNLKKLNFVFSIISLSFCFLIAVFSREIIQIFFNIRYVECYKYIPLIVLSMFFTQISSIFNLMIYQNKKTMTVMWIIVASSIVSVLLNFLLIPRFGIWGATFSTAIGCFINLLFVCLLAKKNYYVKFNYVYITSILVFFTLIIMFDGSFNSWKALTSMFLKAGLILISLAMLWYKYKNEIKLFKNNIKGF